MRFGPWYFDFCFLNSFFFFFFLDLIRISNKMCTNEGTYCLVSNPEYISLINGIK